jgi:hypothetical protein
MKTPRYFTPRNIPPQNLTTDPEAIVHLLDVFIVESPHRQPEEWMVALTLDGSLVALPASERGRLPQRAQEELSFMEISALPPRRLLFSEISLFLVQLMEQPANTPGINDPIYLYGSLSGPIPNQQLESIEGQLTLTRADLLEGITLCAPWAFRYPNTGKGFGCCYSMILPADRPEELSQGKGVILAYALLAPELAVEDASNDAMLNQLMFDILSAMKEDMKTEGKPADILPPIPVLSRAMHEQQLINEGYTIDGNTAKKKSGFLSLFGGKIDLPPQGDAPQYIELANRILQTIPGWPEEKTKLIRGRIQAGSQLPNATQFRPQPTSADYTPPPPPPPRTPRPSDWMNDFIESHHQPGTPPARITQPVQTRKIVTVNEPAPPTANDWMRDFDRKQSSTPNTQPRINAAKPATPPPAPRTNPPINKPSQAPTVKTDKPDWMKDFE